MDNITLRVDAESRDIVLEEGDIVLSSGNETTAQAVRVTLQVYKGEWFLDPPHGTDYEKIMGLTPTDREVDQIIREAVFQETAVKHIDRLDIARKDRYIMISLRARLASGSPISMEVSV